VFVILKLKMTILSLEILYVHNELIYLYRLEHVQEFTRQLDESDDEEEDDMPTIQFKHGGESPSASDKVSVRCCLFFLYLMIEI
jgi:hypothetical protein